MIPNDRLARYLTVALKQRERSYNKANLDYGLGSATAIQIQGDIVELKELIAELESSKAKKK